MKTKKHYLILATVFTILAAPALAKVELPLPEAPARILIGRPFPALTAIEQLYIELRSDTRISHVGITTLQDIHEKVEHKLVEANIKIISRPFLDSRPILFLTDVEPFRVAKLRIDISTLRLKNFKQYIFRIQTSLARHVYLTKDSSWSIKADVWKAEPVMQAVSAENMPAAVTKVVLQQVDAFTAAWLEANPPGSKSTDANDIATLVTVPGKKTGPVVKPPGAKHKFVASKNSKVFHKADCRWVKRIKPKNIVTYSTRDKATEAGKRPCKFCKP